MLIYNLCQSILFPFYRITCSLLQNQQPHFWRSMWIISTRGFSSWDISFNVFRYRICCAAFTSRASEAYLKNLAVSTNALAPIKLASAFLRVMVTEDITSYNSLSIRMSISLKIYLSQIYFMHRPPKRAVGCWRILTALWWTWPSSRRGLENWTLRRPIWVRWSPFIVRPVLINLLQVYRAY